MHFDPSISISTVVQLATFAFFAVLFFGRVDNTLKDHTKGLSEEKEAREKQTKIEQDAIATLARQVQELSQSVMRLLTIVESHEKRLDKGSL